MGVTVGLFRDKLEELLVLATLLALTVMRALAVLTPTWCDALIFGVVKKDEFASSFICKWHGEEPRQLRVPTDPKHSSLSGG